MSSPETELEKMTNLYAEIDSALNKGYMQAKVNDYHDLANLLHIAIIVLSTVKSES